MYRCIPVLLLSPTEYQAVIIKDGRLHTSDSENNTRPVATGETSDKTTVPQQSIQSDPATSILLSQDHCVEFNPALPRAGQTNTEIFPEKVALYPAGTGR